MKIVVLKRYEYPLKDVNGNTYYGGYTIKEGVKPRGYKDEKLVQKFKARVLEDGDINFMKVNVLSELAKKVG